MNVFLIVWAGLVTIGIVLLYMKLRELKSKFDMVSDSLLCVNHQLNNARDYIDKIHDYIDEILIMLNTIVKIIKKEK